MPDPVFQGFLAQARTHADILAQDLAELASAIPFTPERLAQIDSATLRVLDQFNIRFAKLQDVIGSKIFPAVLEKLAENPRSMAFIDRLSRLETLGFIASADVWLELREQRNRLSHDYPDNPAILASELNAALEAASVLLLYWHNLETGILANPHLRQ